jgi:hypothetical protein
MGLQTAHRGLRLLLILVSGWDDSTAQPSSPLSFRGCTPGPPQSGSTKSSEHFVNPIVFRIHLNVIVRTAYTLEAKQGLLADWTTPWTGIQWKTSSTGWLRVPEDLVRRLEQLQTPRCRPRSGRTGQRPLVIGVGPGWPRQAARAPRAPQCPSGNHRRGPAQGDFPGCL